MIDLLLRHPTLLLLICVYPFVWFACYLFTCLYEQRPRKIKTKEGVKTVFVHRRENTYTMALRHTSLLYILYLTFFVTVLEEALFAEGWPLSSVLYVKFVAGMLVIPLSRGIVPFDKMGPRVTFMFYLWLPFSGQILQWKTSPLALLTAPLLIVIWLCCVIKERRREYSS